MQIPASHSEEFPLLFPYKQHAGNHSDEISINEGVSIKIDLV